MWRRCRRTFSPPFAHVMISVCQASESTGSGCLLCSMAPRWKDSLARDLGSGRIGLHEGSLEGFKSSTVTKKSRGGVPSEAHSAAVQECKARLEACHSYAGRYWACCP